MRLIDVDEIKLPQGFFEKVDNVPKFYKWLDEQPTVDAVEVVHCKDCKHNYHNMIPSGEAEYGCTKCIELPITADFYCAWGEREDEE